MISSIISRLVILIFGTLYPAYASYKAVRTKNLKEYVKWMMYWIVFALFTCTETFTDVFLSWFPFYYEVKIVLVLWLLSPATKGSSILYRKFVHPALCRREQEIDEYIAKAKDQGYHTVLNLGTKGVNYATTVIMQTAIKGGGGLVQQLRKSYSLSDLTECEPREERGSDEADDVLTEPRLIKRGAKSGFSTRRSASESNSRQPMYFPEVDVDVRGPRPNRMDEPDFSHIKSSEDISSGYSSADNSGSLSRAGSLGASGRARARTSRTTVTPIKRPQAAEESEVIVEERHDNDSFEYTNMPPLVKLSSPLYLSHTHPPFLYQYIGDQVKIVQVLGDFPLQTNSNSVNNNSDNRDQKEVANKEGPLSNQLLTTDFKETSDDSFKTEVYKPYSDIYMDVKVDNSKLQNTVTQVSDITSNNETLKESEINLLPIELENKNDMVNIENIEIENNVKISDEDDVKTTGIDKSNNNLESAESDDEASFGTPDNSPRNKRKYAKGKYGKSKAPPPPNTGNEDIKNESIIKTGTEVVSENVSYIMNQSSDANISGDELPDRSQIENVTDDKKTRQKSKSPIRIPKPSTSGISKLLQLPAKLAFWHRIDVLHKPDDCSSSDNSRRSSCTEKAADEFQSCLDLSLTQLLSDHILNIPHIEITNVEMVNKIDTDLDNENVNDLIEDGALKHQKLELNSPDSKHIPLHDSEIATTSKSTDV